MPKPKAKPKPKAEKPKKPSFLKSPKFSFLTREVVSRLWEIAERKKFDDFLKKTRFFIEDPKLKSILKKPSREILLILQLAFQLKLKPKIVAKIFSKYLAKDPRLLQNMLTQIQMQNFDAIAKTLKYLSKKAA